ncbi:hypothetical protein OIU78_018131, partial [Salix suchowensis]
MEPASLGKSLAVPCVQDLAKKISPTTVPARYLRLDQDPPIIISNDDAASLPQIPVIDMQRLISDELELDKMDRACREWGFFQLINQMEGFGQAFVVSEEHKLDWGDMFYMITLPEHVRQKPSFIPRVSSTIQVLSLSH